MLEEGKMLKVRTVFAFGRILAGAGLAFSIGNVFFQSRAIDLLVLATSISTSVWIFIQPSILSRFSPKKRLYLKDHGVTIREYQVVELAILQGLDIKYVSASMKISYSTVNTHLMKVCQKLSLPHKTADLIRHLKDHDVAYERASSFYDTRESSKYDA